MLGNDFGLLTVVFLDLTQTKVHKLETIIFSCLGKVFVKDLLAQQCD